MLRIMDAINLLAPDKRDRGRIAAFYSLTWLPLAVNAAGAKATVTTQDDSDFIALRVRAYATDTAAPPAELTTPQATITFTIGSNSLMPDQTPMHVAAFASSAADRRGLELAYPIWVPRSTTLLAYANNLTATAMNLRLVLEGIRLV